MVAAMRRGYWWGACVIAVLARPGAPPRSSCEPPGELAGCAALPEVDRVCFVAWREKYAVAGELCERAWQATRSEMTAVAGAWSAMTTRDDAALVRWGQRSRATIHGSRILRFVSEMHRRNGDLAAAEHALRIALD